MRGGVRSGPVRSAREGCGADPRAATVPRMSDHAPARRDCGPRAFRALRALALVATLAALSAGCGRPSQPPLSPAPPPSRTGTLALPATPTLAPSGRPVAGYVARQDSLPAADPALLKGKRVAIDPGHGGYFRGCMGVNGLSEAEVNLGVALRLRELLVARGATVLMTRDRDRDFLSPADSSLKSDLAERARLANAFAPDVFVSVHHNADPTGRHDVNETQTYYRLGDEGPSYDLGTDLHRSMVRNLGIEVQKLLPGNFSVVRNSDAPSVLTEASYLTHPEVEARLRTPEAQQLEAEAIFTGLAAWFARPRPIVESLALALSDTARVTRTGLPVFEGRIAGACDVVNARVDDSPARVTVAEGIVTIVPAAPLANGPHEVTLAARLAAGGAATPRKLAFRVDKPLASVEAEVVGGDAAGVATPWAGDQPIAVRVRLRDADALPANATRTVSLRVEAAHGVAPVETTAVAANGEAWFVLRATRPLRRDVLKAFVRTMGETREMVTLVRVPLDPAARSTVRAGFAIAEPSGQPLVGETRAPWLSPQGFATVAADSNGARMPSLPGWRTWGADSVWPPHFTRIAGGVLRGKRIAIDPEGGGEDAAGMGRSGSRAATFNLEVARALGAMLEAAGAEVVLTRSADAAVSELERVQAAERFRADRYLRIGHAAAPPIAGYYFSSGGGRRWAQTLARTCAELGVSDSLAVGEAAKYALSQASAVALYASLRRVDDPASEERLVAPGALRAEAYALFVALARDFSRDGDGAAWPADSIVLKRADGSPASGALVTLGGAFVLQADAAGVVRFVRTEPGPIEVRGADSRSAFRGLLLDSDRGRTLTGAR